MATRSLTVNARQQVWTICTSEWSYTEDILFEVKRLVERKEAASPNKNLENQRNKNFVCV